MFGLIILIFFPLNIFPNIYPPISDNHVIKISKKQYKLPNSKFLILNSEILKIINNIIKKILYLINLNYKISDILKIKIKINIKLKNKPLR